MSGAGLSSPSRDTPRLQGGEMLILGGPWNLKGVTFGLEQAGDCKEMAKMGSARPKPDLNPFSVTHKLFDCGHVTSSL